MVKSGCCLPASTAMYHMLLEQLVQTSHTSWLINMAMCACVSACFHGCVRACVCTCVFVCICVRVHPTKIKHSSMNFHSGTLRCPFGKGVSNCYHTHTLHRFVGKEFASVTVEEGVETTMLRLLRAHPQYSCVERIAEIHPQLKVGEEGEEVC